MRPRSRRSLTVVVVAALALAPMSPVAATRQEPTAAEVMARLESVVGASLGPPGGEVRSLVVAPTDASRMYAGTAAGHLYASRDGAATWTELPIALPHDAVVDNLVVHAGNADILFAAYWRPDGTGGIAHTSDGGNLWSELSVPGNPSLRALAVAPLRSKTIYAGGIGGVWRSDDGGQSWFKVEGTGLPSSFIESLAVDPRDPEHVYAGTWRQVYRSRDGGNNWQRIYEGMAIDRDVFSLAISPHDPDAIMAGTCNFLYSSTNQGRNWSVLKEGLATDHNRIHTIVHHPDDPQIVYAGTRGALYRSDDGGSTWRILLAGVSISDIALGRHGRPVYVATEERGVMAGNQETGFDEHNNGFMSSRVVAFDALPGAPRVLFAARADGPRANNSLHFSTDVGRTWKPLGVTPSGAIRVVRAQAEPVNRVLVVTDDAWWSVFPGGRWVPAEQAPGILHGLEIAHDAGGLIIAATSSGLYLAQPETLANREQAARPFDAQDNPIWQTVWDGGELSALTVEGEEFLAVGRRFALRGRVEEVAAGAAPMIGNLENIDSRVLDLTMHPSNDRIAYAVTSKNIFRSDDGGRAWQPLELPWPPSDLRAVAINPQEPDQVLALDHRGALYRGHGDGRYWLVLDEDEGLDRAWNLRLSAQAPGYALIATQGHGVRVVALDLGSAPAASVENPSLWPESQTSP